MERLDFEENPRRRRRSRRHRSSNRHRRGRGRRRNPSYARSRFSGRGIVGHLRSGFSMHAIKEALPLAGGALLNYYGSNKLAGMIPQVASGLPSYAAGIALAGLSSMIPKVGPKLFVGGMTYQALRAINQYVMPGALRIGEYIEGMSGVGDLIHPNMLPSGQMGEYMEDSTPVGTVGADHESGEMGVGY